MTNNNNNTDNKTFLKGTNNMTMKISSLEFTTEMREDVWQGHSVQTKTDAHRMIGNERHAQSYIDEFGDVEIVLNTEYAPYWEVPAFKAEVDEHSKLKQAYCDQYGSN
tara:strand:+ start:85 stop:408 length:324 start_codon:yes stop_codon:yes gene_type:complete